MTLRASALRSADGVTNALPSDEMIEHARRMHHRGETSSV